jgi:aquaglyceroporin related protein, other eukaryote
VASRLKWLIFLQGVMLGIYVAGDSGAYLNPAITLTNCVFRGLPWRRFPMYFLAQFLGGFVAAGCIYANYVNAINYVEGHGIRTVPPAPNSTAGIFCTYPQPFMTKASMFFSEFIASSLLMLVIFALKDDTNNGVSKVSICTFTYLAEVANDLQGGGNWFPLSMFFLIFGLGACFGWESK